MNWPTSALRQKGLADDGKGKKIMKHTESKLQQACVKWFRYAYPQYRKLFFAIGNGGKRSLITARIMKGEGVTAGVADLMLCVPNPEKIKVMRCQKHYHCYALFIELKIGKNTQTPDQKEFQNAVVDQGYSYQIVRTFDEFKELIEGWLK